VVIERLASSSVAETGRNRAERRRAPLRLFRTRKTASNPPARVYRGLFFRLYLSLCRGCVAAMAARIRNVPREVLS
jgi:hypothetical protein